MELHGLKQSESSNTTDKQTYSDEETLIEIIDNEVEEPFKVLREEKEYSIIMGNYKVAKGFKSVEEARSYMEHDTWEMRITIMSAITEIMEREREINKVKSLIKN